MYTPDVFMDSDQESQVQCKHRHLPDRGNPKKVAPKVARVRVMEANLAQARCKRWPSIFRSDEIFTVPQPPVDGNDDVGLRHSGIPAEFW